MSLYQPDPGAVAGGRLFTAQLSQRDLSLRIPLNFVPHPGVATSAACFAHGTYEDASAVRCFSNLLAVGFRRFELDLYWDVTRGVWSFCPVELGGGGGVSSTAVTSASRGGVASLSSGLLGGQSRVLGEGVAAVTADGNAVAPRQTAGMLSAALSSQASSSPSASLPRVSTTSTLSDGSPSAVTSGSTSAGPARPTASAGTLVQAGSCACTSSVNLDLFADVLSSYLNMTETNLNATVRYMILSLHAAAPASDPTGSARRPETDSLPQGGSSLASAFAASMSAYLYTPAELLQQRADLGASGSWFSVPYYDQPDSAYFRMETVDGHRSSPDGWPSESFIEFEKAKRLLVGYGQVDPQMLAYDFSADASTIFPQGYLQSIRADMVDAARITDACFFHPNVDTLGAVNSSWATVSFDPQAPASLATGTANLTACGISPILNRTLSNVTAAENYRPYQAFVSDSIWPWAPGEPRNAPGTADGNGDQQYRCAALNATLGQWQVADCTDYHYAACRVSHSPYTWQISASRAPYMRVGMGCPDHTTFSTPRTGLENTYALSAWKRWRSEHDASDDSDALLWLNFNSLDAATCWVAGQNTTCPYLPQAQNETRQVVVPTTAAVIVFVVAALTVFVKCAANRQSSRRRRRRKEWDGWDYEGVPS